MVQSDELSAALTEAGASRAPLYRAIVQDVMQKIQNGEYQAGDRLMSVGDLCTHYNVSLATAHRSIGEMANLGIVKTIPRKGVYVAGVPTPPAVEKAAAIERVILLESINQRQQRRDLPRGSTSFTDRAVQAIIHECRQRSLPFESQFIPVDRSAVPRVFFAPRSGDAIIAIGAEVSIALMSHLDTPNVPSLLVDAAAANATCVLTDNADGMHQLVEHLQAYGHRRVAIAVCFARRGANFTNENERRDAFLLHSRVAGLRATAHDSGEWEELFALLAGPDAPTALAFTRDVAALEFIRLAQQRGIQTPRDVSVVGFDNWANDPAELNNLTTVKVDVTVLGQKAIDTILAAPAQPERYCVWHRVRPELVIRHSVARLPTKGG